MFGGLIVNDLHGQIQRRSPNCIMPSFPPELMHNRENKYKDH